MTEQQLGFKIERMTLEDIPEVVAVDRRCFTTPWPASAYRREVTHPDKNLYVVLRRLGEGPLGQSEAKGFSITNMLPFHRESQPLNPNPVIGYAGLWLITDEAHVTTIGVLPEFRGQHLGELLLVRLIEHAIEQGSRWVTLEARVSNHVAQALYRKYTFKDAGYRRRYYSDDGEDAVVMWTDRIDTPDFAEKFALLKAELLHKVGGRVEPGSL